MGFRLILTSMTLSGVIALILLFSPNLIALLANYVTVVEDRPIMFLNIVSQLYSLPLLAISKLQRSLCNS